MWRGISLANKCLLLFGGAVVLIILAALSFSWLRIQAIVEEGQRERSRQLAQGWMHAAQQISSEDASSGASSRIVPGRVYELAPDLSKGSGRLRRGDARGRGSNGMGSTGGVRQGDARQAAKDRGLADDETEETTSVPIPTGGTIVVLPLTALVAGAGEALVSGGAWSAESDDPFVARALAHLAAVVDRGGETEGEYHESEWVGDGRQYRYARVIGLLVGETGGGAPLKTERALVVVDRTAQGAVSQMALNMSYLFSAGLISLGLAVLVFYLITNRLILSPVRALRDTAERVREGDISTRAAIETGDEFEELGETFNQMLEALSASQQQLRAINASLDLKVNELAERNVSLFEANKLKGEFLANVSHELRTPLNSILGFADLLQEQVDRDAKEAPEAAGVVKRARYLQNISTAGRHLLELINGLLDMAKLEAGRMELNIELTNVREECEALAALIRPLADRGGLDLVVELAADVPLIQTDRKKLQQIVFNLLSNAVKFTSERVQSGSMASGGGGGGWVGGRRSPSGASG